MAAEAALRRGGPASRSRGVRSAAILNELVALNHTLTHDLRGDLAVIQLILQAASSGTISASEAMEEVAIATLEAERTIGRALAEMGTILGNK
jgi:hypothetical protein